MERIIKSLPAENGELYVTSAGQRRALARFNGVVEIRETQMLVPLLGATEKGTLRRSFMMEKNKDIFIDDRCIIPENVKNMSREQLDREIAELESQARAEKDKILRSKKCEKKMA